MTSQWSVFSWGFTENGGIYFYWIKTLILAGIVYTRGGMFVMFATLDESTLVS